MKRKGLESNFRKYFLFTFTNRRVYVPLLSIYFLTFPDNHIQQIGLYTGIGSLASFLLEIPSGYLADRIGHKKTLILGKICMILSTSSFIIGKDVWWFAAGSIFLAFGFAFSSGTASALMHETLEELGQENKFTKVTGRIRGNVSLVNAGFVILLPLFTKINFLIPFWIGLGLDILGLIVTSMFIQPKQQKQIEKPKKILHVIQETRQTKFWPIAIFSAMLSGVITADWAFRTPYLTDLGYLIPLIGIVMGSSRIIRFLIARIVHKIEERFTIKQLLGREIVFFTLNFILITIIHNPYLVGAIFAIMIGYYHGRSSIINNYLIKTLPNKKYKATMLSVKQQLANLIQILLVISIGFVMNISYKIGYLSLGSILLIGLVIMYFTMIKPNFSSGKQNSKK